MPPITPARPRSWFARIAFLVTERQLGQVPTSFGLLAHVPRLLNAILGVERALAKVDGRDARLQKLAALRAAKRIGCPF